MIFGNKENFAIECYDDLVDTDKKWVFGRMCLWCTSNALGDITEPSCMLNVTEGSLSKFISEKDNLDSAELNELNDEEAYSFLNKKLYGADEETSIEQITYDAKKYFKYDFLTNGGESFDGFQSYIIKNNDTFRILFRNSIDDLFFCNVEAKKVNNAIESFLKWIEEKKG